MLLRILFPAMLNNFALSTASAQSRYRRGPRTVVDYYMLLPDKYFEANRQQRRHWMLDPQRGAIVDVANGYLYAVGDGAQTDIYTRLFKNRTAPI